jgi:hypothetical protein
MSTQHRRRNSPTDPPLLHSPFSPSAAPGCPAPRAVVRKIRPDPENYFDFWCAPRRHSAHGLLEGRRSEGARSRAIDVAEFATVGLKQPPARSRRPGRQRPKAASTNVGRSGPCPAHHESAEIEIRHVMIPENAAEVHDWPQKSQEMPRIPLRPARAVLACISGKVAIIRAPAGLPDARSTNGFWRPLADLSRRNPHA